MTKIKNYFNKMGIDWKYLAVIATVILSPVIYNSIRIFWIVDQGESSLAMTHFSTYLQMTTEIVGAFLLIPLFTYGKDEYKNNSLTLFITISATLVIFVIASLITSGLLVKPMMNLNPSEDKKLIINFLIFQGLTWVLVVYEQYLLTDTVIEKNYLKAIIFCVSSLSFKIIIDLLMLSNFSVINTNVASISISSFISTLIIVLILIGLHLYKLWKNNKLNLSLFDWNQLKIYYIKGVVPAIELLIRNLCYSLVTLQALLMLGESDWNAYNMGGYIYWMIIFKITSIFDYYILSDLSNRSDNRIMKLVSFSVLESILISFLGVVLTFTYLPSLLDGQSYASRALLLSIVNIPIMIFISIQNVFKLDLVVKDKYIFILGGAIVNLIILYTPLIVIIYLTDIIIGFWVNVFIFGMSCIIPTIITIASSLFFTNKDDKNNSSKDKEQSVEV